MIDRLQDGYPNHPLPPFRSLSSLMIFLLKQRACSQATHAGPYDHLKNTMLALFDQRSNHNVKLLPYKQKKNQLFFLLYWLDF